MMIGFILSFLVLIVSHTMGKKAIDEKLINADLPISIRKMTLSNILPRIEMPRAGIGDALKSTRLGKLITGSKSSEEEKNNSFHLLPRIRMPASNQISEHRMQAIRNRVMANYERMLDNPESPEMAALNENMSRDISSQIEKRLKELAEQVEIPLT
jgi:hypothetical protein